jgi:hypothetical protein
VNCGGMRHSEWYQSTVDLSSQTKKTTIIARGYTVYHSSFAATEWILDRYVRSRQDSQARPVDMIRGIEPHSRMASPGLTCVSVPDATILPEPKKSVRANMFVCMKIKRWREAGVNSRSQDPVLSPAPFRQHSLGPISISIPRFHFHHHLTTRKQQTRLHHHHHWYY